MCVCGGAVLFPFSVAVGRLVCAQVPGGGGGRAGGLAGPRGEAGLLGGRGRRPQTAGCALRRRAPRGRFDCISRRDREIRPLGILLALEGSSGNLSRIRHGSCSRRARSLPAGNAFYLF